MRFLAYFTLALISSQAHAQIPSPPSTGAAAPPVTTPQSPPAPPPPTYRPAPGTYDYAAEVPPFAGQSLPVRALYAYERDRKSPAGAAVLSLLWPGLGNLYAGHYAGILITWSLIIGGIALGTHGLNTSGVSNEFYLGLALVTGGIVYSPIDAYLAADQYNRELGARLGLPPGFAIAPTPIQTEHGIAWAPGISVRF